MIRVISFRNIYTGRVFCLMFPSGTYSSPYERIKYTLDEAMKSSDLIIDEYKIIPETKPATI